MIVVARLTPPPSQPRTIDPSEFSAERAMTVIYDVQRVAQPHPQDSDANDPIRDRIISRLEELSYTPEIQDTMSCRQMEVRGVRCGRVQNILVRLPGQTDGPAIMLSAHYDSISGGPGVSDDMSGVGILLEIARILSAENPPLNPIVFIFSDGEENGLLGAKAFIEEHPWANDIHTVINLEARGTAGLSLMFETSDNNDWLIDAYNQSVPRPTTNSLLYDIYRLLPNDTDLTIYKDAGLNGVNFAFIKNERYYHTARDNFLNLDQGTLQHQGESVLALTRQLSQTDLNQIQTGNATYLDILGFFMLQWPANWTPFLAIITLISLLGITFYRTRQEKLSWRQLFWGSGIALLLIIGSVLMGYLITNLMLFLAGGHPPWHTYPSLTHIAVWSAVLLVTVTLSNVLGENATSWGLSLGSWLVWGIVTILLSIFLPGATVLFLVPMIGATIVIALWSSYEKIESKLPVQSVWAIVLFITGIIWLPIVFQLEYALSFSMSPAITLPLALFALTLLPLSYTSIQGVAKKPIRNILLAIVTLTTLTALFTPSYTEKGPQYLSIIYTQNNLTQKSYLTLPNNITADHLEIFQNIDNDQFKEQQIYPYSQFMALATEKPFDTTLPTPNIDIISAEKRGNDRHLSLNLQTAPNNQYTTVRIPVNQLIDITISGHNNTFTPNPDNNNEYYEWRCYGRSCHNLPFTLTTTDEPITIYISTQIAPLPNNIIPYQEARPLTATSASLGDRSLIINQVTIE
ncbi:MAG TPA: M20/M25/M40 family metallo-hydrolase [Anaerolineae bacterium]|nr:M20/M25/M40 family metallo-hydrolase [Anaerolineae bacterium]